MVTAQIPEPVFGGTERRCASVPTRRERGSALLATLLGVLIVSSLVGLTLVSTNAVSRLSSRARDYAATQRAAEAAIEYGYAIWKRRIFVANGAISTDTARAGLTGPAIAGYIYESAANNGPLSISATDQYGAPMANPASAPARVPVSLLDYPGWRGFASSYVASAKVKSIGPAGTEEVVGIRRQFQYVEVPIFQMMFFFQDNMEFYKPATMIVGGLVHTNSNLWASSSSAGTLTFSGNVSHSGTYSQTQDPPFASAWSGWSPNAQIPPTFPNGQSSQVTQVPAAYPMGVSLGSVFNTTDTNPNNDGYREIIEQPVAGFPDPQEIASRRIYHKAGVVLSITGNTATVTAQNGTSIPPGQISQIQSAFTNKKAMYDQREGKMVDVATIDVSKLTTVFNTGGVTGFNGVLYVVDNTPVTTGGPSPSPNPKTIRLQKGGVLPNNGLTIASQNPVYIQGDYNTGTINSPTSVPANATGNPANNDSPTVPGYTRKPSAVLADAVVFLSNAWNDANAASALNSRNASNTTYNTAVMAGFMPSGYKPPTGAQYGYSGGANNFPRFLENWSGDSCTYYGSMVELFQSKTFTGAWDTGNIYSPPARRWNYDTNFSTTSPPGGLNAVVYTRGSWSKF